jgi:hypothetical protein
VQYRALYGSSWTTKTSTSTYTYLENLSSGSSYQVQVRAVSSVGRGAYSYNSTLKTYSVPAKVPPFNLTKSLQSGRPAIIVYWTAPRSDRPIIRYEIHYRRNDSDLWSTKTVSLKAAILENLYVGTVYQIRIRAVSDVGVGIYSDVKSVVTYTVPSRIVILILSRVARYGRPSLIVTWYAPTSEYAISMYQVRYRQHLKSWSIKNVTSTLAYLDNLAPGTKYEAQVRALSDVGAGQFSAIQRMLTYQVPSKPSASITKAVLSGRPALAATWTSPSSDRVIGRYEVRYRRGTTNWITKTVLVTSTVLGNLTVGTIYQFQVGAISDVGPGVYSGLQTITTYQAPDKVEAPVLTKAALSKHPAIMVSWTAPNSERTITSYEVHYKAIGAMIWSMVNVTSTLTTLEYLSPGTTYQVQVRAVSDMGSGPYSNGRSATTYRVASKVGNLTIIKGLRLQKPALLVSWLEPQSEREIISYDIQWRRSNSSSWTTKNATLTRTFLDNLFPGNTYLIRVRATSDVGSGPYSDIYSKNTYEVPFKIKAVTLTRKIRSGKPALAMSWTTVHSELPILGYHLQYRHDGSLAWFEQNMTTTQTNLENLSAGIVYHTQVRAVSIVGAGPFSEVVSLKTYSAPSKIINITVTRAVIGSRPALNISWITPNSDLTIHNYEILYRSCCNTSWISKYAPSSPSSLENLTPDTAYEIQIRAISTIGSGPYSDIEIFGAHSVPTKVSGVKVSRAIKSNRPALLVMWTVHGINERVTAYQVQYRNVSSIKWQNKTISPLSTSTYLENLDLGTRYQVKVNALSDIGDSPDGSISVETTYNVPDKVVNMSLSRQVVGNSSTLVVYWSTSSSDLPVITYDIEHEANPLDNSWLSQSVSALHGNSFTLIGLVAGTLYRVRVRAVSVLGQGDYSDIKEQYTYRVPTEITPPIITKAARLGSPALHVSWTSPPSERPITTFQLQYKRDGSSSWVDHTVTSLSVFIYLENLLPGTTYQVRVRAVSDVGEGAFSAVVNDTTYRVPLNISDISFSKDVVAGKPALRLNWTTPDSERSIIRYQIAYRQIETYIWMTTFSSSISLNLENLSAGTRYEIRIRANSDVGFGSYGETITLETYSVPTKVQSVNISRAVKSNRPALIVTWMTHNANVRVTGYQVQYRRVSTSSWSKESVPSLSTSVYLENLTPNTRYQIRVNTLSDIGNSLLGDILVQTTYNVPLKIHYIFLSRAVKAEAPAIEVSWEGPISERSITNYEVRYREISVRLWSEKIVTANVTYLENLTVDTDYVIQVRATSDVGVGTYSDVQILETYAVPMKVSEVVVTSAVRSSKPALLIEWATYEANERVTAYQVQYRENTTVAGGWNEMELPSTSNSTYIDNLDLGTVYQIRVNALSDIGVTAFGDIVQQKTYDVPSQIGVSDISKDYDTASGEMVLLLSWNAPQSDLPIDCYSVRYKPGTATFWVYKSVISTAIRLKNITTDAIDQVQIAANSVVGSGPHFEAILVGKRIVISASFKDTWTMSTVTALMTNSSTSDFEVLSSIASSAIEPTPSLPHPTPSSLPPSQEYFSHRGILLFFNKSKHYVTDNGVISLFSNMSVPFDYTVEICITILKNTEEAKEYNHLFNTTFLSGSTVAFLNISVVNDSIVEKSFSFQLQLSKTYVDGGFSIVVDETPLVITAVDTDYTLVMFNRTSYIQNESDPHIVLSLWATEYSAFGYYLNVVTMKGGFADNRDIKFPNGNRVSFCPFCLQATLNITVVNDDEVEGTEVIELMMTIFSELAPYVQTHGSVKIKIIDDDSCPRSLFLPMSAIGKITIACHQIDDGFQRAYLGVQSNIVAHCQQGGTWGAMDMSQCTFGRDTAYDILFVEWNTTYNKSLHEQLDENFDVQNFSQDSNNISWVYKLQIHDSVINSNKFEEIQSAVNDLLSVIRYISATRSKHCRCCDASGLDLNNRSLIVSLCIGVYYAPVACSCENNISVCKYFYSDVPSGCYLDTDGDRIPDIEDSCVGCCSQEVRIFQWPKTQIGLSAEKDCSQLHPSFGDSKVKRKCLGSGKWEEFDLSSCTFKNTTGIRPFVLYKATVDTKDLLSAEQSLFEQAPNLLLEDQQNDTTYNVTEVASYNISDKTMVIFNVDFSGNVKFAENYTTSISQEFHYIQAMQPSYECSCKANRPTQIRRLCIGEATRPCDCNLQGICQCIDPYALTKGRTVDGEKTCALDSDGDGIPDHKDNNPYEYDFLDPGTLAYKTVQCQRNRDSWGVLWHKTTPGVKYARCPGGIKRSSGLAKRECRTDGTWKEVDVTSCATRAIMNIESNTYGLFEEIDFNEPLTDGNKDAISAILMELQSILTEEIENNIQSLFPKDLISVTGLMETLASLSEYNGLFISGDEATTPQQELIPDIIGTMLKSRNAPAFEITKNSENSPSVLLLSHLEQMARSGLLNPNSSGPEEHVTHHDTELLTRPNIVLQSTKVNPATLKDPSVSVKFPSQIPPSFQNTHLVPQVIVPGNSLIPSSQDAVSVVAFTMNNLQSYLPLQMADQILSNNEEQVVQRSGSIHPASLIVSIQVIGANIASVQNQSKIQLSFKIMDNIQDIHPTEKKVFTCAFWNHTGGRNGTGGWSTHGLKTIVDNETHILCESEHLTTFIVLVSTVPNESSTVFKRITYIGCSISLLCLMVVIIFYFSLRKELLGKLHNFVNLNLCLALSCGLILFIAGIEHATGNKAACVMVSALQHYFFLSTFCWMLCEAILMYIIVSGVFKANNKKWILFYLGIGWGLPLPVVVIAVGIRHDGYFTTTNDDRLYACWLPQTEGLIWAFIAPILTIILVNVVILVGCMYLYIKFCCRKRKDSTKDEKERYEIGWQLFKAVAISMPLLGFTWILGLFAVAPGQHVVTTLFVLFSSLQGMAMFILHVIMHHKVWSKLKGFLCNGFRTKGLPSNSQDLELHYDEILMDNNVTHEEDYSFVIDSTKEHKDGQQETMMLESMAKIENPTNS